MFIPDPGFIDIVWLHTSKAPCATKGSRGYSAFRVGKHWSEPPRQLVIPVYSYRSARCGVDVGSAPLNLVGHQGKGRKCRLDDQNNKEMTLEGMRDLEEICKTALTDRRGKGLTLELHLLYRLHVLAWLLGLEEVVLLWATPPPTSTRDKNALPIRGKGETPSGEVAANMCGKGRVRRFCSVVLGCPHFTTPQSQPHMERGAVRTFFVHAQSTTSPERKFQTSAAGLFCRPAHLERKSPSLSFVLLHGQEANLPGALASRASASPRRPSSSKSTVTKTAETSLPGARAS